MIKRNTIHPLACCILGLAHVVHGLVMILSFGLLSTNLPFKTAIWTYRMDMREKSQ